MTTVDDIKTSLGKVPRLSLGHANFRSWAVEVRKFAVPLFPSVAKTRVAPTGSKLFIAAQNGSSASELIGERLYRSIVRAGSIEHEAQGDQADCLVIDSDSWKALERYADGQQQSVAWLTTKAMEPAVAEYVPATTFTFDDAITALSVRFLDASAGAYEAPLTIWTESYLDESDDVAGFIETYKTATNVFRQDVSTASTLSLVQASPTAVGL